MPLRAVETFPVCAGDLPEKTLRHGRYEVRFARTLAELEEICRLRYEVFNLELGEGLDSSVETGLDVDEFDAVCHHLVVIDRDSDRIVGCYRMQSSAMAERYRGFYSEGEFDLAPLGEEILGQAIEVGRACVAKEHRSTQVLFLLWRGLALYVATRRKRFLFGCCSLTSQDPLEGRAVMDHLRARGHVHPELSVDPRPGFECRVEGAAGEPPEVRIPPLFRIYLRHGALVCSPPAIDRRFKTIDYLVLFDVDAMDPRMFGVFFDST
jgi:putative hemolysin